MNRREMLTAVIGAPLAALFARDTYTAAQRSLRGQDITWPNDIVWPAGAGSPELPTQDGHMLQVTFRRIGDQLVGQWWGG